MKKHNFGKFLVHCVACLVIAFSCIGFTACDMTTIWSVNNQTGDGFDTEIYEAPDYIFDIAATETEMQITLDGVGYDGETAYVVALRPYEYLYGEESTGMSNNLSAAPVVIDEYTGGSQAVLTCDRYFTDTQFAGYDGIYMKYFVIDDIDDIIAGPKYCTQIAPVYDTVGEVTPQSKKGLMNHNKYDAATLGTIVDDLGCSHVEFNLMVDKWIMPNEMYVDGKIVPIQYEETVSGSKLKIKGGRFTKATEVEKIIYNNQTYYFAVTNGNFKSADKGAVAYANRGVAVTMIIYILNSNDQTEQPYFMKFPSSQHKDKNALVPFNTSNEIGAGYWGALMEFLGNRWSQPLANGKGKALTYVIGNEIDYSSSWNTIVEPGQAPLTLDDYVTEYERQLRIANAALKKYSPEPQVLVPFTHWWGSRMEEYCPKDVMDALTLKTLKEGNYNYGMALHPYGDDLTDTEFWKHDLEVGRVTGSLNTPEITWSNLEIIQLYLEQPNKLCNDEIRSVYLTEGGVSSSCPNLGQGLETNTLQEERQAAGVAYAYYKASQLDCIKAIIYYKWYDTPEEGCLFGIAHSDKTPKMAYEVWKFIDTQYSFAVADKYLSKIEWVTTEGGSRVAHGKDIGNVSSYFDTMTLITSRFDWNEHWNESAIMARWSTEEYLG